MHKWHSIIYIISMVLLWGCITTPHKATPTRTTFQSYKNIPGVTKEEINAIEKLKQTRPEFIYGVNITMEAFVTENNTVDGFARLFCERLSVLFGIPFTPQVYGWDELKDKLGTKDVDFTGELTPNPERKKQYVMSAPIAQRTGKIFVHRNADKLSTIAKERPIRCAFQRDSTVYALVKASWTLPFEPIFVDDTELPGLFEKRAIDAFIDEHTMEAIFDKCDFVKTEDFFPLIYSPVSLTTGNADLAPIVTVLEKYLQNGGSHELTELYKRGIDAYASHKLSNFLSAEEKAYIKKHNTAETAVPFAVENDNYPVAFYNPKDHKFQGIAVDVLQQVTRLTGLQFKVANKQETTWPEMLGDLTQGKIAIVSELVPSRLRQGKFLWSTDPYCVAYYTLLSRADFPDVDINQILYANVGLIAESAYAELFHEWFPASVNTRVYIEHTDAFDALERGDIDLLMGTQNMLLNMTNYLERPGFKANLVFQHTFSSVFGINKNEVLLQSIIDKAQRHISLENIAERWKRKVFDYNSKMLKDILPYMSIAIGSLLLGFAAAFLLLMKNRRMSKNLEHIVAERTVALEQASRAKSDFLSSMSHEMRTPMNAIIGMAKIADHTSDVPKLRYCLDTIKTSSTHLLRLINDILDMSKIEAGKYELDTAPFNIEKMLIKICNLLIDNAEQKKQTLNIFLSQGMHLNYIGDELRLSQVIANLLSNAIKFTPKGGKISLAVEEVENNTPQNVLRFSITDTGIGMTNEQISRLFTAFEQADGSITKRFGGTGLGLAISKNIVEKMNGRIWAESAPDKGSTFHFEVVLERPTYREAIENFEWLQPSDINILIVVGNQDLREHFCAIIKQFGFACHDAENAHTGIQMIQQAAHPYDVIFIEYNLPDSNGLEAIEQLHGNIHKNTIVMLASFFEWNKIETTANTLGIYRFISKPLFPSTILETISSVAGKSITKPDLEQRAANESTDFSSVRLLLVEDVPINQEIFIALLEHTGIQVDTAENGREAVHAFAEDPEKYNLIIMDVQMPVMDGYEATRIIRAYDHPRAATIPIIAMTANAFKEDVDKCLASGMNDHMPKPIDEKIVIEKIRLFT